MSAPHGNGREMAMGYLQSWWQRWAETIRLCTVFYAAINCVNAMLTLAGQLPTPDLVQSPQFRDLSARAHIVYLLGLFVVAACALRWWIEGGWWLVIAVSALRISDNLHPGISAVNVGQWLTVATIGTLAFFTMLRRKKDEERQRGEVADGSLASSH